VRRRLCSSRGTPAERSIRQSSSPGHHEIRPGRCTSLHRRRGGFDLIGVQDTLPVAVLRHQTLRPPWLRKRNRITLFPTSPAGTFAACVLAKSAASPKRAPAAAASSSASAWRSSFEGDHGHGKGSVRTPVVESVSAVEESIQSRRLCGAASATSVRRSPSISCPGSTPGPKPRARYGHLDRRLQAADGRIPPPGRRLVPSLGVSLKPTTLIPSPTHLIARRPPRLRPREPKSIPPRPQLRIPDRRRHRRRASALVLRAGIAASWSARTATSRASTQPFHERGAPRVRENVAEVRESTRLVALLKPASRRKAVAWAGLGSGEGAFTARPCRSAGPGSPSPRDKMLGRSVQSARASRRAWRISPRGWTLHPSTVIVRANSLTSSGTRSRCWSPVRDILRAPVRLLSSSIPTAAATPWVPLNPLHLRDVGALMSEAAGASRGPSRLHSVPSRYFRVPIVLVPSRTCDVY